jgi:hypothetical protein
MLVGLKGFLEHLDQQLAITLGDHAQSVRIPD